MKTYTKLELDEILRLHSLWLRNESGGVRADLSRSDLSGSNLSRSDLSGSNLSRSDLSWSDLSGSNLSRSNLSWSNLSWSNLSWSDLSRSDLSGSNLSWSDLSRSNLSRSDLSRSNLSRSNLSRSNLSSAKLDVAAIRAEPWGPLFLSRSQVLCAGELTVYKKVRGAILELKIPAAAFRQNAIGSRKCRVNKAFVVRALNSKREEVQERKFASMHDACFLYCIGEWVEQATPDDFTLECGPGIHCFATFEEAVDYE